MTKNQRNAPAADKQGARPAVKIRRDLAGDTAAHALRLLEKVRAAAETRASKDSAPHAAAPHAIVVGGGIAGLVAAREMSQTGYRVTVLEASDNFGGCLRRVEVAGLALDAGAESFALRGGTVSAYLDELDLSEKIAQTSGVGAWLIQGDAENVEANPLPPSSLLGIPSNIRSDEVRRIIGRAATVRAAADLVTPMPKKWATEKLSLAEVVRHRMGQSVLDALVAPVVNGVYSTDPARIDIDAAAPGLREAMQRTGSLAKAVAQLQGDAPAGSRVAGLDGGMYTLVTTLTEQLQESSVALVRNSPVTEIRHHDGAAQPYTVQTLGQELGADRVVIATEAQSALKLLNPLLEEQQRISAEAEANSIALVVLVVDKPELDDAPRGSGALVAKEAPLAAKAMTHASAKWPWLAEQSGPGTHVLRLSFGRIGQHEPLVESGDEQALLAQAVKDASKILGVELHQDDVVGSAVSRFNDMVPLQGEAASARRAQVNSAVEKFDGLDLVGAWLAGTGLARVIGHTRRTVAISAR
ncbi:protoporphyrinogen oxidase [Arthrobacter sp. MYb229]|uniref:protoporphyrinogen oxidase n=1 Tax=unclassified Arthrobacter TaxID=235627 RepID=UPI000CFC9B15|nr:MULTISPECIES: protoporphyrinogen oxidase [unclassified Arthrobacter]PRA06267.1 protoporphyrinogen oxidase [Arthrobacter sp. MYb229]PRB53169.1 protoporphyrinogen oxidase [Arthrobacter sp. MYb216]